MAPVDDAAGPATEFRFPPKFNHKKSRYGCKRCRDRKVKCNEEKPACHNCQKYKLSCLYDRTDMGDATGSKRTYKSDLPFNVSGIQVIPQANTSQNTLDSLVKVDPPETRMRRLLEVKLMHHYITQTGSTIGIDESAQEIFAQLVPKLSLESDALLYSTYVMAALHLHKLGNGRNEGDMDVHRIYLSMALREHREEVSHLSIANVDVACLTAAMLRICAFATLQERPRQPYTPPVEWLLLSCTTHALFIEACKIVGNDPKYLVTKFMRTTDVVVDNKQRFDPDQRRGLGHILSRDLQDQAVESWDSEIQDTYESTLSYIGDVIEMTKHQGVHGDMMRRIMMFPMLVKSRFVELVQERQPRALVLLAYYFGLLARYHNVWYIGDSASEEIRAMATELTGKWLVMLKWPLQQSHK